MLSFSGIISMSVIGFAQEIVRLDLNIIEVVDDARIISVDENSGLIKITENSLSLPVQKITYQNIDQSAVELPKVTVTTSEVVVSVVDRRVAEKHNALQSQNLVSQKELVNEIGENRSVTENQKTSSGTLFNSDCSEKSTTSTLISSKNYSSDFDFYSENEFHEYSVLSLIQNRLAPTERDVKFDGLENQFIHSDVSVLAINLKNGKSKFVKAVSSPIDEIIVDHVIILTDQLMEHAVSNRQNSWSSTIGCVYDNRGVITFISSNTPTTPPTFFNNKTVNYNNSNHFEMMVNFSFGTSFAQSHRLV